MKRLFAILLVTCFLLGGCSKEPAPKEKTRYNATFLSLFDTLTTVVGYAESKEEFTSRANAVRDKLEVYHKLFDIYNDYEGLVNLKYVNDHAGSAPVIVNSELFEFLKDLKTIYSVTNGKVNAAMGSVLNLWHEARNDGVNDPENAYLPDENTLKNAYLHADFDKVILNEADSSVFFADPLIRLDVGAVAKGWAVQRVAKSSPSGLLISVGGNVCATGPRDDAGNAWVVGIQSPDDPDQYLHTVYLKKGSIVTSGDYQRSYTVNGKSYHHIIDPETLYPSTLWRSVTVICPDSGYADALSTALFLMTYEDGLSLLAKYSAEAVWADAQGSMYYSPGFQSHIRT